MRDNLTAEVDKERAKVEAQIAAKLAEAERRIAETKAKALASVGDIASEVAGAIVARLIGAEPTKDEVQAGAGAARGGVGACAMTQMAEFWVAVAFVVFLLILLYYKVPKLIAKSLDDRAEAIRKELDEARRLREEAQNLLADYQKKHRNVGQEAEPSSIRRAARRRPSRTRRAPA